MMALARAVMLVLALGATCAHATDIEYLAPPGVPAKEFPAPKRPVAQIVSPSRSGEEHRDSLDENGEIVRLLGLKPGMTVGDIGAGSGYHTVRLSPLVGPSGSVVAEDVTRDYLVEFAKRTQRLGLKNVVFALGEPHDPRLPASSLDAAILVHMYHEIAQPYAFALQPCTRVQARRAGRHCRPGTTDGGAWHANRAATLRTGRGRLSRHRHLSTRGRWRISRGVFAALTGGSKTSRRNCCLQGRCRQALITAIVSAKFRHAARARGEQMSSRWTRPP